MGRPAIDISRLTAEEKLELIDDLWASLGPAELELTLEQRAELDARLDRVDRDGPVGVPWESVRSELSSTKK